MSPDELADGIKELFIDDAAKSYKEMYVVNDLPDNPTQYQKDIHKVISSLDNEARESFFNMIQMVCTDSATSFCAFLDGSCGYVGQDTELQLVAANNPNELLNGSLVMRLDRSLGNE